MTVAAAWKSQATPPTVSRLRGVHLLGRDALAAQAPGAPRALRNPVRLTLFGGIHLRVGDREIALKNRKALALVAYLALTPGMKEARDRLTGLLWSESDEPRARASLRQLLHSLRDAFGREGLTGLSADKLQVSLDPGAFTNELDGALASIDTGHPLDCLMNEVRVTETLLYGYDDVDPSFAYWLGVQRESVRQRLIRRLEAKLSVVTHPAVQMKGIAHALFQVDPTHELACQKLMRAYVETGDIAGALVAYKRLWEHLEQDHDVEPSLATQELVVAIKRGTYRPSVDPWAHRDRVVGSNLVW